MLSTTVAGAADASYLEEAQSPDGTDEIIAADESFVGSLSSGSELLRDPFAQGEGFVEPFALATNTGGTASWDGTPTSFTFDSEVTPEPSSYLLFGTGLLGIIGLAWRRKRLA